MPIETCEEDEDFGRDYDRGDDPICAKCGRKTIGESCGRCGRDLCPMCFECGAGYCGHCGEDMPNGANLPRSEAE